MRSISVRKLAVAGIMGAVSVVLGTTGLGFIPVPTAAGNATIMHLPVILAAVAEGPIVGMLVGLIFGIFSLMQALSPIFVDPLVAVLPRLCIGLTAAYAFQGFRRFGLTPSLISAAVVGSATNTVLVLGMAALRGYMAPETALVTGVVHGTPEIIVAAVAVTAVGLALSRAGYIRKAEPLRPGDAA